MIPQLSEEQRKCLKKFVFSKGSQKRRATPTGRKEGPTMLEYAAFGPVDKTQDMLFQHFFYSR